MYLTKQPTNQPTNRLTFYLLGYQPTYVPTYLPIRSLWQSQMIKFTDSYGALNFITSWQQPTLGLCPEPH